MAPRWLKASALPAPLKKVDMFQVYRERQHNGASRRLFFGPIPTMSPEVTLATRFTAGNRLNAELALKPKEALHDPAAGDAKDTGNQWGGGLQI